MKAFFSNSSIENLIEIQIISKTYPLIMKDLKERIGINIYPAVRSLNGL